MNNIKIFNKIEKSEVVSFDIYDTLIYRNVLEPKDIFEVISFIYKKRNHNEIELDYTYQRVAAEKIARRKNVKLLLKIYTMNYHIKKMLTGN